MVYLARRHDDSTPVALKILIGEEDDPESLARFRLEGQVVSRLSHPGIVRALDVGQVGRHSYCAFEYCPGPTLRRRIEQRPLGVLEAGELVAKLARVMDYAHSRGVLHRDLKPANVLLEEPSGDPRVTDFGLARDRSLRRSLTRTGDVLGTPAYMAPEQIRGEREVDQRADVYALGVTLYQCLTGELPYLASTVPALVQLVMQGNPLPPHALNPGIPTAVSAVCLRAMAYDRHQRYGTALAFAEALEASLHDEAPARAAGWARWVAPAVGVVIGLGAGAIAWIVLSASPAEAPGPRTPGGSPAEAAVDLEAASPSPFLAQDLAPDAELRALGDVLIDQYRLLKEHAEPDIWGVVSPRLDALLEAYPKDPRLPVLVTYRGVMRQQATALDLYRDMSRWRPSDPPLPPTLAGILGRSVAAIGFQRAGRDLIEKATAVRWEHPWAGLSLMHLRACTAAPVQDVARACDAAEATIQLLERTERLNDLRSNPPAWDVYINLALYRLALSQRDSAIRAAENAARVAGPDSRRFLASLASAIRAGEIEPDSALDRINGLFGHDAVGRVLTAGRATIGRNQPLLEARQLLIQLAKFAQQPEEAALIEVSAARAFSRGNEPQRALELLERARERVPTQAQVRRLVERCLARALLELKLEPARAELLAREVAEGPGLTRGERADAWVLVARAQRLQGQSSQQAVAAAEALDPFDRRELDALR